MDVREATTSDEDAVWTILEPVFRAGDTYAIDADISREKALSYWLAERAYVVEVDGVAMGTYYIQRNRPGGGAHYCNCGFVTARGTEGRGVARAMLEDALDRAKAVGFDGMVFNFVVESNARAVALWKRYGFEVTGRVPNAFQHPDGARADALVMFREL